MQSIINQHKTLIYGMSRSFITNKNLSYYKKTILLQVVKVMCENRLLKISETINFLKRDSCDVLTICFLQKEVEITEITVLIIASNDLKHGPVHLEHLVLNKKL